MDPILILTDLDRTLIPNGHHPESPGARPIFKRLAARKEVNLAYVSGRDLNLLKNAVEEYDLPIPDFAIGDVGTSLYKITEAGWKQSTAWQETIAEDWHGVTGKEIADRLGHISSLTLQEPEKQGSFKVSYYTSTTTDREQMKKEVSEALEDCAAEVSFVHSIDEVGDIGLFDILPAEATKLHAVEFLIEELGVPEKRAVYSGDSGNDMEVLVSGIKSTLVANASPEVKETALKNSPEGSLYQAKGGFLSMNGNYCAGILEGLVHFIPEIKEIIMQCSGKTLSV